MALLCWMNPVLRHGAPQPGGERTTLPTLPRRGGRDHRRGPLDYLVQIERQILLVAKNRKQLRGIFGFSISVSVSCKFGKTCMDVKTTWPIDIRISSKHFIFDITAICHVIQYQLRYDYHKFKQDYKTIKCYKLENIKLLASPNHKKPFF